VGDPAIISQGAPPPRPHQSQPVAQPPAHPQGYGGRGGQGPQHPQSTYAAQAQPHGSAPPPQSQSQAGLGKKGANRGQPLASQGGSQQHHAGTHGGHHGADGSGDGGRGRGRGKGRGGAAGGPGGASHGTEQTPKPAPAPKPALKPTPAPVAQLEEFDFHSSNTRFNKEKEMQDLLAKSAPASSIDDAFAFPAATAYSKSSFFDNLSCEATDKQARKDGAQNFSHKQQRELDVETFGSAGGERGRFRGGKGRGRGGGKGKGGGGGGRRGGGKQSQGA